MSKFEPGIMPAKSTLLEDDLPIILASYDLGKYQGFKTFANGAGQTTLLLETDRGRFVLRYYENRTNEHVQFEVKLFNFLESKNYPVPKILKNREGEFSGIHKNKPYIIIEFIEGKHGKNPNDEFDPEEMTEVVKVVAQLHNLTKDSKQEYFKNREVYDIEYCWGEFQKKHPHLVETEKGRWLKTELDKLQFPPELPKGLCHADLNYGNFLFRDGKIATVLDFDMSFYTHLIYDVASLIYWWAWPPKEGFKKNHAERIIEEYSKWRVLDEVEKAHIYDALKLIILLGISWSDEGDFEGEREKIEFLHSHEQSNFKN